MSSVFLEKFLHGFVMIDGYRKVFVRAARGPTAAEATTFNTKIIYGHPGASA